MNPLELRYTLHKSLNENDRVYETELKSPVPGEPVVLTVFTLDGRRYTVSIQED